MKTAKHPVDIPVINKIFEKIPENLEDEYFENILKNRDFLLERIITIGQITPKETWLCEDTDEWVLLLSGAAKLKFKSDGHLQDLMPGDHLTIPAGTYHRVEWTVPDEKTVWLALHHNVKAKG